MTVIAASTAAAEPRASITCIREAAVVAHTWDNVVAACRRCNTSKRDRLLSETTLPSRPPTCRAATRIVGGVVGRRRCRANGSPYLPAWSPDRGVGSPDRGVGSRAVGSGGDRTGCRGGALTPDRFSDIDVAAAVTAEAVVGRWQMRWCSGSAASLHGIDPSDLSSDEVGGPAAWVCQPDPSGAGVGVDTAT